MTPLSVEEQHYLQAAFAASPIDWFRPRTIGREQFSDLAIDKIIQSLVVQGLIDGEPECHARLTDKGRKKAAQLRQLSGRDWRKFYKRRKVRIVVGSVAVGVCVVVIVLRSTGLL